MNVPPQSISQKEKIELAESLYEIYGKIHECEMLTDEEQRTIFTLSKLKYFNPIHEDMLKRIFYILRMRLNKSLNLIENNARTSESFRTSQSFVSSSK